ncbi:ABC transporter substrate-binding protein [Neobacillus sp. BF23-41]|uniref:ABC transporter substrate-binding protein n=1 Tax=Neobacillus sp. BF23-41 TaxID=3240280 RepID=UPI0034E43661
MINTTEKLALNDKINLFIGTITSGESMALAGKLKEWNSVYVSTTSENNALTNPVNPYLFRANYSDNTDMIIWKYWLQNTEEGKKAKTFYSVCADYTWGHDQTKNFKGIIAKYIPGGEFLSQAFYPLGTTDYSAQLNEAGGDVGGTWYWNRYPGLRCDSESIYFNYFFSEELYQEWTWSSRTLHRRKS